MINGRRQPSNDGTSRMMREYQVRICERLGVQFPGPTRQGRRGRPTALGQHCPQPRGSGRKFKVSACVAKVGRWHSKFAGQLPAAGCASAVPPTRTQGLPMSAAPTMAAVLSLDGC
jgi:hypothetical protein